MPNQSYAIRHKLKIPTGIDEIEMTKFIRCSIPDIIIIPDE